MWLPRGGTRRARALISLLGIAAASGAFFAAPAVPCGSRHREWIKAVWAQTRGARFTGESETVLQTRGNDCGAACLKMVLDAHGIECSLPALTARLNPTAKGASMLSLRLTAGNLGLAARSWAIRDVDFREVPLPAIAFINGDHFVVIRRLTGPEVIEVDDPALGRLRWPLRSFRKRWSGEALVFDPSWAPSQIQRQLFPRSLSNEKNR